MVNSRLFLLFPRLVMGLPVGKIRSCRCKQFGEKIVRQPKGSHTRADGHAYALQTGRMKEGCRQGEWRTGKV